MHDTPRHNDFRIFSKWIVSADNLEKPKKGKTELCRTLVFESQMGQEKFMKLMRKSGQKEKRIGMCVVTWATKAQYKLTPPAFSGPATTLPLDHSA
jgi:hypothetical protein